MPAKEIFEIRLLPPLVIGRLGSSEQPLDNYEAQVPENDPLGYRRLVGAPTFLVSTKTGEITSVTKPEVIRFRDEAKLIRPVCPFVEVWARFDKRGALVPLTSEHLRELDLKPADIKWRVVAANLKVSRRTGDKNDGVEANTDWFSDHAIKQLQGKSGNFVTNKFILFGSVRYIRPNPRFPQIRLRFTPATGKVYGPSIGARDANVVETVYDPEKGGWLNFFDGQRDTPPSTSPSDIYAGTDIDNGRWHISRGYLDDECSGTIEVEFTVRGHKLIAYSHFTAGPPTFAPDSFPVRTIADELEQIALGPNVSPADADQEKVIDIVRRALETVRLINTAVMNGNQGIAGLPVRAGGQFANNNNMAGQDTSYQRAFTPIFDPSVVDALAIRARHERVLMAVISGTPAWFLPKLRHYTEVGDLTDSGRRKMPGMMRGADALYLALTRRQYNLVKATAPTETDLENADALGNTIARGGSHGQKQ